MIQATLYACIALLWAVFLSVSSMATAIGFNSIDQRALGHTVVLLVYVCGGVGVIGYWKQVMSDPTIGVAASMASMVVFFNITREGSLQLGQFSLRKVLQYFFIVVLGLSISNAINYLLWPVSARKNLKRGVTQTTSQYSHLLSLVTTRFLDPDQCDDLEAEFQGAVDANQSVFESIQKNLKEAKHEYFVLGQEAEYRLLEKVTGSVKNLAQHLNGLKSSCEAQLGLLRSSSRGQEDSADDIVKAFAYHLGPPMKSLAFTTKQALQAIQFDGDYTISLPSQLFSNLERALALYEEAREAALTDMYKHRVLDAQSTDKEEIAASMDYFSYNLQEFVMETQELMYLLKELEVHLFTQPQKTWTCFKFWRINRKRQPETMNMKYRLWRLLNSLQSTELRFAMKVGFGAAVFAAPAMIDSMRPTYVTYRLEWGLLSFFIVLNASVGGTYSAAFWRVTGSALGTILAVVNWTLFPANPYLLAPLGVVIAAPCMYMVINPTIRNAQFGRFILLSYNLSALYAFSISHGYGDDDDEGGLRPLINLIAYHRIVAVTAGCVWGAIVNTYVWPIKARVELRLGLSKLWLEFAQSLRLERRDIQTSLRFRERVLSLRKLLAQTPHEPRLKGAFPVELYSDLLDDTDRVLDYLHSLKSSPATEELSEALFTWLYLLSSSLLLKAPIPIIVNVKDARRRLLKCKEDTLFSLMSRLIILRLDSMTRTIHELFIA